MFDRTLICIRVHVNDNNLKSYFLYSSLKPYYLASRVLSTAEPGLGPVWSAQRVHCFSRDEQQGFHREGLLDPGRQETGKGSPFTCAISA